MYNSTEWVYDDGGRAAAGFRGRAGDCTVRAIAIATEQPYRTVYDELFRRNRIDHARMRRPPRSTSPRDGGTTRATIRRYMDDHGWVWTPTCHVGSRRRIHVCRGELPATGRYVLSLSRHLTAWVDGALRDTYDCSRGGMRMVYGYWRVA